jgi:hypothetical protein
VDKINSDYWMNVKVGDIIQLTDEQTIEYLLEEGVEGITNGADFVVQRIKVITEQDNIAKWILYFVELQEIVWYIVAKIIDDDVDVKVYYQPDDFKTGNRQDMIDNDCWWLYDTPDIIAFEDLDVVDLVFNKNIEQEENITFSAEYIFYGKSREDEEDDFATVIEYEADTECDNPDILVLELCEIQEDEENENINIDFRNSFIMLLQGCNIGINEISVLK